MKYFFICFFRGLKTYTPSTSLFYVRQWRVLSRGDWEMSTTLMLEIITSKPGTIFQQKKKLRVQSVVYVCEWKKLVWEIFSEITCDCSLNFIVTRLTTFISLSRFIFLWQATRCDNFHCWWNYLRGVTCCFSTKYYELWNSVHSRLLCNPKFEEVCVAIVYFKVFG